MNQEQINGIIRIIIPTVCAWLAIRIPAVGDPNTVGMITTAVIAVGAVIWSFVANNKTNQIKAVESMSDVKIVVGPDAPKEAQVAAADTTRPKVVIHEDPLPPSKTYTKV